MKQIVIAGFVVAALLFVGLSFSDQTDEANQLVGEANKHIQKGNEIQKQFNNIQNKLDSQTDTTDGDKESLKIAKELEGKAKEQEKEAKAACRALEETKELNVSAGFKKYMDTEVEAAEAYLDSGVAQTQLANKLVEIAEKVVDNTLTEDEANNIMKKVEQLTKKVETLEGKYGEFKSRADKYYKDNELGG